MVMACEYEQTPSSAVLLAVGPERFLRGLFGWKIEGSCLEIEFPFSRRQLCVYLADSALPVEIFLRGFMPPKGIDINHGERRILFVGNLDFYSLALISD